MDQFHKQCQKNFNYWFTGFRKNNFGKKLKNIINADWINADDVRKKFNDWDFSKSGILRQSKMKYLAEKSKKKYVIADFVCPYNKGRKIFKLMS